MSVQLKQSKRDINNVISDKHASHAKCKKNEGLHSLKKKKVRKKNDDKYEKKSQIILLKNNMIGIDSSNSNLP